MENSEKPVSGNDSARPWESYNTVYTTAKAGRVQDPCQFFKIQYLDCCILFKILLGFVGLKI